MARTRKEDKDNLKHIIPLENTDCAGIGTSPSGAVYVEPRPVPEGVDLRFFTRLGGVSEDPFNSLNVSRAVGDSGEAVEENLSRINAAMGGGSSAWVKQVAGKVVVEVDSGGFAGEADGLVTSESGLSLSIGVADCAPVALVGRRSIGMVHSGWRGTLAGISGEAVRETRRAYGETPAVYIGPCIRRCCYEVSEEIADDFREKFGEEVAIGRQLSIPDAIIVDLKRAGVPEGEIHDTGICTGCRGDLFFSHRTQKPNTGRNLSVIARRSEVAS